MSAPPTLRAAVFAQVGATACIVALAFLLAHYADVDPTGIPLLLAMLQGGIAAIIAKLQKAPPWWLGIHLAFAPLAAIVQQMDIDPQWFLAVFILLLLVYWRTDKSRVPLYLTNRTTAATIGGLLPTGGCRLIDLGCGEGGLLRRLALTRPESVLVGIEHAPLTWLIARLQTLTCRNVVLRWASFWDEPLNGYDVIYAFLSPAPMAQLAEKLGREMGNNALFISNSFPIPGVSPARTVDVADGRRTRLYLYTHDSIAPPNKTGESIAFPTTPTRHDQQ